MKTESGDAIVGSSKHMFQWFAEFWIVVLTIATWMTGVEQFPEPALGFLVFATFASIVIVISWGDELNRRREDGL